MTFDTIFYIIEFIGIFSYTVTATIVAVRNGLDCVGALIFSLLTCFGGGFMRDLILGIHPPHLLFDVRYGIEAIVACILCFIFFHLFFIDRLKSFILSHEHDFWIDFTDAIGLSVFCVCGVDVAIRAQGSAKNALLLIFCGCITGVGGGILRDICSAQIPILFRKHIYLLPALLGATFYTLTYNLLPHIPSMLISIVLVVLFRVFAILFKWNLPSPGNKLRQNNHSVG